MFVEYPCPCYPYYLLFLFYKQIEYTYLNNNKKKQCHRIKNLKNKIVRYDNIRVLFIHIILLQGQLAAGGNLDSVFVL